MGHLWSTDLNYSTRVLKHLCNIYLISIFNITSEGYSGAKLYFEYSHKWKYHEIARFAQGQGWGRL